MERFISAPLEVPVEELSDLDHVSRADVVLYGLDHSGSSYEARVFLDAPDADVTTPTDAEHGYAGSAFVFGHGACYGEDGHCNPRGRTPDAFERRADHPLMPWTTSVIITDALRRAARFEVVVCIVAVDHQLEEARPSDALTLDEVRLLLFEP